MTRRVRQWNSVRQLAGLDLVNRHYIGAGFIFSGDRRRRRDVSLFLWWVIMYAYLSLFGFGHGRF